MNLNKESVAEVFGKILDRVAPFEPESLVKQYRNFTLIEINDARSRLFGVGYDLLTTKKDQSIVKGRRSIGILLSWDSKKWD